MVRGSNGLSGTLLVCEICNAGMTAVGNEAVRRLRREEERREDAWKECVSGSPEPKPQEGQWEPPLLSYRCFRSLLIKGEAECEIKARDGAITFLCVALNIIQHLLVSLFQEFFYHV